ncbi:MAG: sigma 54-interacting transcriptional regulator [Pseudomonadota bacterium]
MKSYMPGMLSPGTRIDKTGITIPGEILRSWQGMVNTMSEIFDVPAALITKIDPPYIKVLRSSESNNNPYKAGDKGDLSGRYCEEVIKTRNKLLIPNALKNSAWDKNPDTQLGMISYLGLPLLWPDGEVFGAICVLDSKENNYEKLHENLMFRFRELVEAHLALVYKNIVDRRSLEDILDNLTEGIIAHDKERLVLFFNRAAEKITGYQREDVVGRDCHDVFGAPFCGGRCSFQDGAPDSLDHLYYPLNIVTRQGEPRRLEMTVSGMGDDTSRFVGAIASFRDVTDLLGLKIAHGELKGFAGIVGRDPAMLQVYRQIRDLATNDYPVHISGETGTGKELVAAGIHNESRRGGKPFVPVNCAALPEGTLESELFGHVKGAFTGAIRDKKGRFELANNGTIFLDEVADLPRSVQAKLLRVLQDGTFERVGGEKTLSVDVRIISATNRDLKREMERGNFREDLYYRINVVPIHLPLLRERKNDIPLLVGHFLAQAFEDGQTTSGFSKEAMAVMMDYPWPGNVRELQSAIRFALVKSRGRVIQPDHLPIELKKWRIERSTRGPSRKLDPDSVRAALAQSGGNKAKAARILGVGRATLYRFLADFPDVS